MIYKAGVQDEGIKDPAVFALGFISAVYALYTGKEVVITSILDSDAARVSNSLHAKGMAVDARTRDLNQEQKEQILKFLKSHLSPLGFDCLIHGVNEHLHVEYDPKGRNLIKRQGV